MVKIGENKKGLTKNVTLHLAYVKLMRKQYANSTSHAHFISYKFIDFSESMWIFFFLTFFAHPRIHDPSSLPSIDIFFYVFPYHLALHHAVCSSMLRILFFHGKIINNDKSYVTEILFLVVSERDAKTSNNNVVSGHDGQSYGATTYNTATAHAATSLAAAIYAAGQWTCPSLTETGRGVSRQFVDVSVCRYVHAYKHARVLLY